MKGFLFLIMLFVSSARAEELTNAVIQASAVLASPSPTAADFIVCDEPPVPNSLREVNSIRTQNQRGCEALTPGKHRLMNREDGYRSGNYLMRNLGEGRFAAVLNVNWRAGIGATPQLVESMKARTMNCLRGLAPYLRNGNEQLEIQVISPDDELARGIPRPKPIEIEVTPQRFDYRGDAGHYGSNFTCRTIGHEMLHMVGLCDEYHEGIKRVDGRDSRGRTNVSYLDWSCRPVTSTPSYMRDIYIFNSIVPQMRRCDCGPECQQVMKAPEEIRSMFLSNDVDQFINNEMSLTGSQIVTIESGREITRTPFCVARVDTLGAHVKPVIMKSAVYQGEKNGAHIFVTHRPRFMAGTQGTESFYWFGRTTYTCNCTGDTQGYCQRLIQNTIQRIQNPGPRMDCPMDITSPRDVQAEIGAQSESSGLDESTDPPQLVLRSNGNGQSLIRPQHFERIKAGNCRGGAARNYELCEEFAYQGRNRANNYKMRLPVDPNVNLCRNLPPQCLDDQFYLDGIGSPAVSGQ